MTHIEAVRAELVADATVTGLVGSRIYPQKAPDQVTRPFVVLSVVSDVPGNAHGGAPATRLCSAVVQVDCYAASYLSAQAIATAVDNVLGALERHTLSAQRLVSRDLYEPETDLHRISVDFVVQRLAV